MKRLSAQNQMYLAIAIVLVLTLTFVFFAILPNFQEASSLNGQIAAEEDNLATAQALVARRQSAKAQSAADEVELMHIANQVPDSPHLPAVIIELQDVANASGVDLPQLTIGEIGPARPTADGSVPAYNTLGITLTFSGEWDEVIDFCRRLNSLDRGVRVVSSTFSRAGGESAGEQAVLGSASIEVYMMASATAAVPTTVVPTGQ